MDNAGVELKNILFYSTDGRPSNAIKMDLQNCGIELNDVPSLGHFHNAMRSEKYQAAVLRFEQIDAKEMKSLVSIRKGNSKIPIFVTGGKGTVENIVQCVKAGANDVAVQATIDGSFVDFIARNLKNTETSSQAEQEKKEKIKYALIGTSPAIEEVRSAIDLVAGSQTAVLISGESGTGKEVVARLIHSQSPRSDQPFIALNCAALPKEIIENELFGHENGAFTGALKKKIGNFEAANGGTMFFDEIAEMNPDTQAKLLRVIEQKSFRRLGGENEIHVDVRTIGATNKNISDALKSGEFRQDLYYRFSVIEIQLPPLRDRKEDIPQLVNYFMDVFTEKYGRPKRVIKDETLDRLVHYEWPGNVRELRNIIERLVVIGRVETVSTDELPDEILIGEHHSSYINIPIGTPCEAAEQQLILRTLEHVKNNKSRASKMLGVSRKTLHTKLKKIQSQKRSPALTPAAASHEEDH